MPKPEVVTRALSALRVAADVAYFFDSLASPNWIAPLAERGLFDDPPAPIREKGTISFPMWPQSRYLKRMAAASPEEVLKVIRNMSETENVRVHEDFVEAATAMPASLSARIVPKVLKWMQTTNQLLLPYKVGELAVHLAQGREAGAALSIMRELWAVHAPPTADEPESSAYRLPPEPRGRFYHWQYNDVLEKYCSGLMKHLGASGLQVLCDVLDEAVAISRPKAVNGADHSLIWRASIEESDELHEEDIRNHLITAIRKGAFQIIESGINRDAVIACFTGRPWDVFRRLLFHILQYKPEESYPLARSFVLDPTLPWDAGVFREFWQLVHTMFPRLTDSEKEQFLQQLELHQAEVEEAVQQESSPELRSVATSNARHWLYRRLLLLESRLPGPWVRKLEAFKREFGPLDHPDQLVRIEGVTWAGPETPKSEQDIHGMSIEQIVHLLQTWQHSGHIREATPEGFGRALSSVVAKTPGRFADAAEMFCGLDPTYVRHLLSGLTEARKGNLAFSWEPVIRLCQWTVSQPRDIPDRVVRQLDQDPDWGWARRTVASLFSAGFAKGEGQLPLAFRIDVSQIVAVLVEDPEPTPQYEAQFGGKNMDPFTLSINTTRGEALHTVIRYALWVRSSEESDDPACVKSLDTMPEVRTILEAHLDRAHDPAATIRAVYGQWFPWLVLLDPKWTRENIGRIFPPDELNADLWEAAWDAYVVFSGTYDNAFDLLISEYKRAIQRLGRRTTRMQHMDKPENRLAEHLMVFYWRGKIPLPSVSRGLLEEFYQQGSVELRRHALMFVGLALHGDDKPPAPEVVRTRLQELWDWRCQEAAVLSKDERSEELSSFGWWFASRKFPDDWALRELLRVLPLIGKMEAPHLAIDVLGTMVSDKPEGVVEALTLLIERDQQQWGLAARQSEIESILRSALESTSRCAREVAAELVHALGARGHQQYRGLLTPPDQHHG